MNRNILLTLTVMLSFITTSIAQERQRQVKQYTIEQFMNTTRITGSSISHDDKLILFSSNKTGIFNAYTIPVTGGEPTQLTNSSDNSIFIVSFFPTDNRILYSSDQGGNELAHLFLRREDGSTMDLTPEEKARAIFYGWARDSKSFFFGWNQRDAKFMDVYEMDIATFTPTLFYQNDSAYSIGSISNDKRYIALTKTITRNNSEMYLVDRTTGTMKHLSPHEGDISYDPQSFSLDSKQLYYLTDEGSEFTYLKRYDIAFGKSEVLEEAPWDIMYARFSYDNKYRIIGINNDARTEIRLYDHNSNKRIELPRLPDADITSINISRSEKLMTFYVNGSRSPSNLYVYDFGTRQYRKLTESQNPEIDPNDLVEARVVRYKSYDGLDIPAILYTAHQTTHGGKSPALVMVHGGPGGQARIGYSPLKQYLVNHGYTIIDVNNRGSSGYGKSFFKMDDKKHGDVDLRDCVEAKTYLTSTGLIDRDKVGIIGGSYGGYMVLAAMAFRPDIFTVGVNIFGVSNWLRTLKSIPPWWEAMKKALYEEMGDPVADSVALYNKSPLFHAEKIRRPLIVLQGANDPRVLQIESDEIVEKVKANGVPVEYIIFSDEGHGFLKKENEIRGYKGILDFLDQHLRGVGN